jgi:hypothetical protein
MYIGLTAEQEKLRQDLRDYYGRLLTPAVREDLLREHGIGPKTKVVRQQMAKDGWLCFGWPKEYGGQGRDEVDHFIFFDESMRAAAPVPMLTVNTVGPTIMRFGTEEQKKFFLPKLASLDLWFCQGFSEPGAGSDLASLKCAAKRDGDHYIVNGQKTWTTLAQHADWIFLLVRSDPGAANHHRGRRA